MYSARSNFGGVDAHANKDSMDSTDSGFRLLFPPLHGLVQVLVQGFRLCRCQLETFEPFFVARFRQSFRRVVREEVAWCTRSNKK